MVDTNKGHFRVITNISTSLITNTKTLISYLSRQQAE